MKKLYILTILSIASLNAFAQRTDDDVNKEVLLYREFNPTLNDAEKINQEPSIYTVKKANLQTNYVETVPSYRAYSKSIAQVTPSNIYTSTDVVNQIGYLKFGAGNYGNLDGKAGLRVNTSEQGKLNLWASYLKNNGDANYLKNDINSFLDKDIKAKLSDLNIHLDYNHQFEAFTLNLGANYRNLGFNYYGNPFIFPISATAPEITEFLTKFDFDTEQKINLFNINAKLFSNQSQNSDVIYSGNIEYTNFSSKKGFAPSIDKGPRGGIVDGGIDIALKLQDEYKGYVGARAHGTLEYFTNREKYEPMNGGFSNFFNFSVNPYYKADTDLWSVEGGMNIAYVRNFGENKIYLSPNIKGKLNFANNTLVYLNILGGVDNNTYVDMINANRYISLYNSAKHSYTPFDIQLGVKTGSIDGVELSVFGGYKSTKDAIFYSNGYNNGFVNLDKIWTNQSTPEYYSNLHTGHIGAKVATKIIPYTTLSVAGTGYFYSAKNDIEVFNRPSFEAIVSADINPIENLTINAMYILQTGRKGAVKYTSSLDYGIYDMKNINEVNLGAEYNIIPLFSIFARVNNIFNQKYETLPGYPLQGINILGGFALTF